MSADGRIKRLRPLPDLDAVYPEPHDHRIYGMGHHIRVEFTKVLARSVLARGDTVADLSCGNGAIANDLRDFGAADVILGDYAQGRDYLFCGRLEDTLPAMGHVNLYICSETLEHLDVPSAALALMRDRADKLVLSTPLDCWEDANGEHLWAWNREGVESLLVAAGWRVTRFATLDSTTWQEPYVYGMWCAR